MKKNNMDENGGETKTSTAALSRVISIPPKPFLLIGPLHGWKCAPRHPSGSGAGRPDGD